MRNVLSVIGEYAGLLDDLLTLAEKGKALDHAQLKKLSANITPSLSLNSALVPEPLQISAERVTALVVVGM